MALSFDRRRVLFFPVTPFDGTDRVDLDRFEEHLRSRLHWEPGAVFAACGTGEYHALDTDEYGDVVARAVAVAGGSVPVVAGAGGPLGHARRCARAAADAGADALLVMPPYLVRAPQAGLLEYVDAIAAASDLDLIVYHRDNAALTAPSVERLLDRPRVVGLKDGVGDLALTQQFAAAVARVGRDDVMLFNGLLTAELSQAAYEGVGVHLYSSAAFAFVPDVATAYLHALRDGDEQARMLLLAAFYEPLVRLRDETPGFAVALVKAGVRLDGVDVGPVRAPLVDPTDEQTARLADLIATGRALVSSLDGGDTSGRAAGGGR